jgi:hypothetical protein
MHNIETHKIAVDDWVCSDNRTLMQRLDHTQATRYVNEDITVYRFSPVCNDVQIVLQSQHYWKMSSSLWANWHIMSTNICCVCESTISHRGEFEYVSHSSASSPYEGTTWSHPIAIALLMCFEKHNFVAICIVQSYPHNFSCGLHLYFNFPTSGWLICRLFKANRFRLRA